MSINSLCSITELRSISISYMKYANGRRTGLVTFCVETAFYNGLLKERYEAGTEVKGRRGRRRRNLLDDLKERRGYSHLKEEALDRNNLVELCSASQLHSKSDKACNQMP